MQGGAQEWRVTSIDPELGASNYASGARQSVRPRWDLYKRASPYEDIHLLGISTARNLGKLSVGSCVVDGGASDGELALQLRDIGFHGRYLGIDRWPDPPGRESIELLDFADWLRAQEMYPELVSTLENVIKLQNNHGLQKLWTPSDMMEMQEGRVEDLVDLVPDNSVDALFAFFMLYHLDEEARKQAYDEFLRILKPDGIFVAATSGQHNKPLSRNLELGIARHLSDVTGQKITEPPYMNANFTSESAPDELETKFPFRYEHSYHGMLSIDTLDNLEALIKSVLTMENQFVPAVDTETFKTAVNYVVLRRALGALVANKPLVEHFYRTLLVCSQIPLELGEQSGFVPLPRSKK